MPGDNIKISILEDGTISIDTDEISGPNHVSADEFLTLIEKLTGTKTSEKQKAGYHMHTHGNRNLEHVH